MASKYWLKLYYEILDDPKMGQMSNRLWRRTLEFFLLAGEKDEGGLLPSIDDMAWRLRMSPEELETDLVEIQKTGVVTTNDGAWIVTNFADRQRAATGAERTERWREGRRNAGQFSDETVTEGLIDTDKIQIILDKDEDKDNTVVCPKCAKKIAIEHEGQECKWHNAETVINE